MESQRGSNEEYLCHQIKYCVFSAQQAQGPWCTDTCYKTQFSNLKALPSTAF